MELQEARKQIDLIDAEISKLLEKRFELSKEIGKEKERLNLPLTNTAREQEILAYIVKNVADSSVQGCIIEVYNSIFKASKSLQNVK